jgi:hypothetical protein
MIDDRIPTGLVGDILESFVNAKSQEANFSFCREGFQMSSAHVGRGWWVVAVNTRWSMAQPQCTRESLPLSMPPSDCPIKHMECEDRKLFHGRHSQAEGANGSGGLMRRERWPGPRPDLILEGHFHLVEETTWILRWTHGHPRDATRC